ncbi:MAG: hypothetical protein ACYS9X_05040 [Planctomycetota bacterium]|jgi:chromosome segregation ATPase
MPDNKSQARGWWVPSKRVPVRILDVLVIAAAAVAGVLLILTIIGFSIASSRGAALATAAKALQDADVEIRKLKSGHSSELEAAKTKATGLEKARDEALASAESLQGQLATTTISLDSLNKKHAALKNLLDSSDEAKQAFAKSYEERSEELKAQTVRRYEVEQKNKQLGRDLAAAQARTRGVQDELKRASATAARAKADWAERAKSYEAQIADAKAELAKRQTRIDNLETEFGDIPIIPLTEDLARMKWEEIQKDVASRKGREDRIDLLFRAKLVLAGTSCESAANRSWVRERQERQASLEREAAVVYGNVTGKIRSTPDAHEENLRLLNEALRKVKDSRYEDRIVKMIQREKAYVGGE